MNSFCFYAFTFFFFQLNQPSPLFSEALSHPHMPHPPYFLFFPQVLGQVGKVLKVYADGDLRVAFGGQTWTFNPACLSAQPVEVDTNLMTAENPNESGSKASAGTRGLISNTPAPALPSAFVHSFSPVLIPALSLPCMHILCHVQGHFLSVSFKQCVNWVSIS